MQDAADVHAPRALAEFEQVRAAAEAHDRAHRGLVVAVLVAEVGRVAAHDVGGANAGPRGGSPFAGALRSFCGFCGFSGFNGFGAF